VWFKLSASRDFTYAFESFLRRIWASCTSLVQYTSGLLKEFVPSTYRIFSLAASCNTSFWDYLGLTTNHDTLAAFWRFLAKSVGLCIQSPYDEPRRAQCFLWAHGDWADESHTHHLQCRGKHANFGGFLPQMMQVENVRVCLFVKFFFFFRK